MSLTSVFHKLLCKIGLHKWSRTQKVSHGFRSKVYDCKKKCKRCGKVKKWVESK